MNRVICLIVAAAFGSLFPASCRKAAEDVKGPETGAPAPPAETTSDIFLEGMYVGGGVDADGNAYNCDVEVQPAREVYWVTYYVDDRIPYPGVAMRRGNLFVVGYRDDRGVYGVVAYTIKIDGSLEGTSANERSTKTGTERLEKK